MNRTTHHAEALLNENLIDVRHYWNVLMGNKWQILLLAIACSTLAYLVASQLAPQYRATTTVLIESREANVVSIEGVYGMNPLAKEYFLTQFEILKSRELAERLMDRLDLTRHPDFDPRQRKPSPWQDSLPHLPAFLQSWLTTETDELSEDAVRAIVLEQVVKALRIEPISNTQLVKVSFDARDSVLAASAANTMAEVYIDGNMEARLKMTQQAAGWLNERLEDLSAKLKESENRLQDYREKETLVDMSGVNTLNEKELNELTLRHLAASDDRTRAEKLLNQIRAFGTSPSVEQMLDMPSILNNELVRTLKATQAQADIRVAELSKRYGPRHPKMISARAEAEEARAEVTRQVIRVMRGLETDYQRAVDTENAIASQLAKAKLAAQSVNRKEFRLGELEREVTTSRQLYDLFLTRAKEAGEAGILPMAHARVVDPARPPQMPVSPNIGLIVGLTLLGSLILCVLQAFLRDAMDNTLKIPDEMEDKLHTRTLGFLPRIKTHTRNLPVEGFLSAKFGAFAEAVRSLRTGVILSNIDNPHKTIVVTSSQPGEGKSTVALNLAESLGQMERVLLIEADLRQPVLARTLDIAVGTPGLTNLIAGTHDLKQCIQAMPGRGLDVLVAGALPGNPQELLSSKRIYLLLEVLKRHYDRIVIDTPPTLPVSDAIVLSTFADGVIYVIRAGTTSAALAARGLKRLTDVRAPVIGSVLNQMDLKKQNRYGEYYAADYLIQGKPLTIIPQAQRDKTEDLVMP